jgi:hypothetical protein
MGAESEPKPRLSPEPEKPGPIARWVASRYRWIGGLLSVADPQCGNAMVMCADAAGLAWQRMAKQNRQIRDIINRLMTSSATAELLMAHLPLLLAVLTHHVPAFRKLVESSSLAFLAQMNASAPTTWQDFAAEEAASDDVRIATENPGNAA